MQVGTSRDADARTATAAAVGQAVGDRSPAVVMLFVSPAHDVPTVAATAREVLGAETPVVGCTTSGEISSTSVGSGHVVAVALGGEGLRVQTAVGRFEDGARQAGEQAAAALLGLDAPHRALLLLADGLAGARSELVRGAYAVAGAEVPFVGGCAGDELAMRATFQIHGDEVLTGVVVGVGLGSPSPIAIGVGHGWRRLGEPMVVTESDGHRVFTLDDRPAADAFEEALGAPLRSAADPEAWRRLGLSHPVCLTRSGGEEIRAVLGIGWDDGSLVCGDVPRGSVLSAMEGDAGTVADGTRAACEALLAQLAGAAPVGLIAFDCAARRAILGEEALTEEVATMTEYLPGVPVAGFYTMGEFARTRGARGVHNATLVLMALT